MPQPKRGFYSWGQDLETTPKVSGGQTWVRCKLGRFKSKIGANPSAIERSFKKRRLLMARFERNELHCPLLAHWYVS